MEGESADLSRCAAQTVVRVEEARVAQLRRGSGDTIIEIVERLRADASAGPREAITEVVECELPRAVLVPEVPSLRR